MTIDGGTPGLTGYGYSNENKPLAERQGAAFEAKSELHATITETESLVIDGGNGSPPQGAAEAQ